MKNIKDIQDLAVQGFDNWKEFGNVHLDIDGDLILFNYNQKAMEENRWNFFETVSRGLIINKKTGEIIARPFDKFFNWGEGNRQSQGKIVSITEKIDGSLGILYRNNGYKIATRGSFHGEQAEWATKFLNNNYNLKDMPNEYTLLFEIIYPKNRVIIDYGDRKDLVLLDIRDRFTGEYMHRESLKEFAIRYKFNIPESYNFIDVANILNKLPTLGGDHEGFVVEFSDGQRFKFKGDRYKELHRMICSLSFKNTIAIVENNQVENFKGAIPNEFLHEFDKWVEDIKTRVIRIQEDAKRYFDLAPKGSRKEFALWVKDNCNELSSYLFAKLDVKDIKPIIYDKLRKESHNVR